ncbi:ParB/RepB/Spo0J family partition protein [Pseudactinotalea sp. HY158]|uniref:ParB/RepB/Spo0J family partition protein n=1 Tax=Pseudactinotalea sp. HY158 TaxID=2654547 RepID=UPI00129C787B|nr:ParB/RepB/Spo0J family partition protein [Pseudactinotalea sp. HY158]QGH70835.1 ParB/RepB/Spo0J family partition protein [Pseudactinotalea sp. HY158]
MSERRKALGRGLGALIPTAGERSSQGRPVDVFFPAAHPYPTGPAEPADAVDAADPAEAADAADPTEPAAATDRADPADPAEVDRANRAKVDPATADRADQAVNDAGTTGPAPEVAGRVAGQAAGQRAGGPIQRGEPTDTTDLRAVGPGGIATEARRAATEGALETGEDALTALDGQVAASSGKPGDAEDVDGALRPVPGATFARIPIDDIAPNRAQPRTVFAEEELVELSASIAEVGVLQPIVVRPRPDPQDGDAPYELIMGERRWRAAREAGLPDIPAIVRSTTDDDLLRDALLENLHRVQLNPLEEAAAYRQLLDDFGCTHEELSTRIARSRPQISNTLRLLRLPPLVQRRVAAGVLSAGHARALLGLTNMAAMERLAQRIVAEGLSVRATEEAVALGEDHAEPARRRPRAGGSSPALEDLASRLADRLDTKVKVNLGQRKGRISIEFASVQDLNRILGTLAPEDPGIFRAPDASEA